MYVFLSVSLSVHSFLRQILMYVADIFKHARGFVGTLKQILNSPGWGIVGGTNVMETQMEREKYRWLNCKSAQIPNFPNVIVSLAC